MDSCCGGTPWAKQAAPISKSEYDVRNYYDTCGRGSSHGGLDPLRDRGEFEDAGARAIEDRVRERGSHRDDGRLAGAKSSGMRVIDEHDVNLRKRRKSRDGVIVKIRGDHFAAGEIELLGKRIADTHHDAAFGLLPQTVGIEHD